MPFNEVAGIVVVPRQSGDPRLREQTHSRILLAGHRLRYDLSRQDHPEDPLRGHLAFF